MAVDWLTVEDQLAYCRNEIPTEDHQHVEEAVDAALSAMNTGCNRRFFVAADTATARVFRPNRERRILFIDDCAAVTSVTENGSVLTVSTDYALEPLNGLSVSGQYRPYSHIRRLGQCWYTDDETATVAISAAWGWTAIPAGVVESWLILVRDITANRDVKFGLAGVTDFGGVRVRQASVIADLQAAYGSTAVLIA